MSDDALLARQLLPLLDLTCLDEEATPTQIAALCARADHPQGRVAAVCVYPEHVQHARSLLPESIAVATVVNFPDGGEDARRVAREIRRVRAVGAQEIDAVLPWQALLQGREGPALQVLHAAREASGDALLKIILETGELAAPDRIALACELALEAGADFLKTSTGKASLGATMPAVQLMLDVIRSRGARAGIKAAGGIRTLDQAEPYLRLVERELGSDACASTRLRIGASVLLDQIEAVLSGRAPSTGGDY